MTLLAAFILSPSAVGDYSAEIGLVGSGGLSHDLSLTVDGRFRDAERGCFSNETTLGRFRQIGSIVLLLPDESPTRRGLPRRYRLQIVNGNLYLLDLDQATNAAPGPLTLRRRAAVVPA